MTQAPVARGSPHTHAGLASRATAKLQPPVPGVGSRVLCAGLGGRRRCPGQQPPAPRTPSPRASEVQPRGRVGTGVLRYTRPCRAAGKALLSPVEIKHRMGMGREGVWQQPAAGSGRGLGRGGPPVLARGFCMFSCSHLPGLTFNGDASRVSHGRQQRGPCGPRAEGSEEQPAAPATHQETPCPGLDSWGGGKGGSSHFTLFREYEFTCKSRGWAPSRPPGPLVVETGSRSCTKWEWGGVRDPEQPARGVTGCAFGWEAAGQESWGCRNLLKTPRLFFP